MLQNYVSPHSLLWNLLLPVLPLPRSPEGWNGVESIALSTFRFHFTHFQASGLLYGSWSRASPGGSWLPCVGDGGVWSVPARPL